MTSHKIFTRIAEALERLAPPDKIDLPDLSAHSVYLWQADKHQLQPVENPHCVPLDLLVGIASPRDILRQNTEQFARAMPANNALLWGARGMGKSSLIKAVHADVGQG
ncbi:MAG: DUF815 domain-containing protein, partial [Proteobacteria bacterium]|nr:DUF815 domain-containing protein [Pseudomonadota bacterium]